MTVLTTLFPVFFMLLLGLVSHIKGWVTVNQKNGANSIIFKILFPVLVFNLMANANIELSHISIILYVSVAQLDRASDFGSEGLGFDSSLKNIKNLLLIC